MKKVLALMLALVLTLTLAGCKNDKVEDTSAADLADAIQKLSLDVTDSLAVTSDITLQSTGLHDSVITWSSSNTDVVTNDGVVTRPAIDAGDASVTLTATVTIGDLSDTKDFTIKVLELVPSVAVTIAEFNSTDIEPGDVVEVTGVVFGFVVGAGVQIYDETGFVYVYGSVDDSIVLGDEITVTGEKTVYFGLPEVTKVASIVKVSSGNDLPDYETTSVPALFDEDPYDTAYWTKPIQVTGMVSLQADGENTNTVIVATDEDGMAYDIVIYYKSDDEKMTELAALEGKIVTADVIVYGYHDGLKAWRVTLASNATFTSEDPTDVELAQFEAGQIDLGNTAEVLEDLSLNTSGTLTGTTISWASDNEAVITSAGVVNRVAGADTTVVLTATVTVGTETFTRDFTVVVVDADAALETITVAEAMALDDGAEVVVKAYIAGFNYAGRIFFQDADGTGIYLHATLDDVNAGDEVIVRATMSSYNDIRQFADLTLVKVVSTGNDVFVNTTATPAEVGDSTAIATTQNRLYKMTLTVSTLEDGSYTLFAGNGTSFFSAFTSGSYLLDILENGDTVEVTFFVTGLNGTDVKIEVLAYGLTDEQNLAAVESMIDVAGDAVADLTLKTELSDFDATITWASSDAAVVSTEGVVVRPAVGEDDVTVTLTASVVIGTADAVDYTYEVVVKAEVEVVVPTQTLFFSEYAEADGGSCKYIEIYNASDAEVNLSDYSIVKGGNGTAFADSSDIEELTGTLAAGAVLVVGNPDCVKDSDKAQDSTVSDPLFPKTGITWVESTVVGYINGDDALGLFYSGVLVDVIGTNGTDPGSNWAVGNGNLTDGTTENCILVRVPSVTSGETDWAVAAMQWIVSADDRDYSTVGTHTVD